jgi:hypothetical protein
VGLRVIARAPGLLEDGELDVVDVGERPAHLGREPWTRRQGSEVDGSAREAWVDDGTPPGQHGDRTNHRHVDVESPSEESGQRDRVLQQGTSHLRLPRLDHPGAVLGVRHEGELVEVPVLDWHARGRGGGESGDDRVRQGGESEGAA